MHFIEAIMLIAALSVEAFIIGVAYGSNKIRLRLLSIIIIIAICISIFFAALLLGHLATNFISTQFISTIACLILFILGIFKLIDVAPKEDIDYSKSISSKELALITIAISLESVAVGFSAGLVNLNFTQMFFLSIIGHGIAFIVGKYLGGKVITNTKIDTHLLSGVLLIFVAVFLMLN